jgi:hypothetical protein
MARVDTPEPAVNAIAILARILSNGKIISPTLARHLLKLGFSDEDKSRMHELAVRNQSGLLSAAELQELDSYVKAGCLLGILHSKARQALKSSARKSRRA